MSLNKVENIELPIVALRGLVIFPKMVLHFDVARDKSVAAVKTSMETNQQIFLIAQKDVKIDNPEYSDLLKTGVIANIKQIISIPDSEAIRVVVEGKTRGKIVEPVEGKDYLCGVISEKKTTRVAKKDADYQTALLRNTKDVFEEYAELASKMSPDIILSVLSDENAGSIADYISSILTVDYKEKQKILDILNPIKRLEALNKMISRETELLKLSEKISSKVEEQVDKNQKDYYLREQMKAISSELNDGVDEFTEIEEFKKKIEKLKDCSDEIKAKLTKECEKLQRMGSSSVSEATVLRNYITTCLSLPWGVYTKDNLDLTKAKKVLDRDHYGLEKVKERIVELLAVRKLAPDIKGQIICLVGPPGVGKTSIAKSLAKAMGRNYVRISLGGVRDEAEIRGHRKTYIGSMPGRIINSIINAKSSNPLVLLDEIDKLGSDFKGDPSSALLEVLDGEQNNTFVDHYLEIPYDLSKVLFLTTANDMSTIPPALLDRMEVIDLYSYTHEEKFNIAKKHLVRKMLKEHGLKATNLKITDAALHKIIDGYTREAGVRKLEREIAHVCRKAAVGIANNDYKKLTVKCENLEDILGPVKFREENELVDEVGTVNGLAWTSVGGEMLKVEVAILKGKGNIELTGSLGDVMKESAKAAISYVRSKSDEYGIEEDFYKTKDIHIHVPEGAVPKDGPSAGVTMATALVSALTNCPVKGDVAMTGEISLRGKVMPIGGLKEKSMAAYRAGIKTILIPKENEPDLAEIDDVVKNNVKFIPVKTLDQVFSVAIICSGNQQIMLENTKLKKDIGVKYEI